MWIGQLPLLPCYFNGEKCSNKFTATLTYPDTSSFPFFPCIKVKSKQFSKPPSSIPFARLERKTCLIWTFPLRQKIELKITLAFRHQLLSKFCHKEFFLLLYFKGKKLFRLSQKILDFSFPPNFTVFENYSKCRIWIF